MSEGQRLKKGAPHSERADETTCWWGLFDSLSYPTHSHPDQPTQSPGKFHQRVIAWKLCSLPWGEQKNRLSYFSHFMWLGINISLLWWLQLSLGNSVSGLAFCLHNVWIQLVWKFAFIEPCSLAPLTSPCVYVCVKDSWPQYNGKTTSSRFEFDQMTGSPHKLGHVTLLMTLKPQLPAQPVWEDMEMNFWQGAEWCRKMPGEAASSWGSNVIIGLEEDLSQMQGWTKQCLSFVYIPTDIRPTRPPLCQLFFLLDSFCWLQLSFIFTKWAWTQGYSLQIKVNCMFYNSNNWKMDLFGPVRCLLKNMSGLCEICG